MSAAIDSTTAAIDSVSAVVVAVPEQIGLWGLLGILYPLLLLVGLRLLRAGTRRGRVWARRRIARFETRLLGAGVGAGRVSLFRRAARLGTRALELLTYLVCIYLFSLYFFLLIPGTRELGLGMAHQFWPPLRAAIVLVLRTFAYIALAAIVLALVRWLGPRIRQRLGVAAARATTHHERERLLLLRCLDWLLRFTAAVIVAMMLPGPGRWIGLLLVALALVVMLVASRRTLENVAAGFVVGRLAGMRPGARIACGPCRGTIEEWKLTGLVVRDVQGSLVHLPYRMCEEAPLAIEAADAGSA